MRMTLIPLIVVLAVSCASIASAQSPASADTTDAFLRDLQSADDAFYDDDLLMLDTSLRDSLVAAHEELGLEELARQAGEARRRFHVDWAPISDLTTFNRAEGFVAAARATIEPFGRSGVELRGDGAYATGSEEFRYRGRLDLPLFRSGLGSGRNSHVEARFEYGDQVLPFGANRPTFNALRAVISGADEQDYLRRRGGRAMLRWIGEAHSIALGYEATRESSVGASTEFALFGDGPNSNLAVAEGIDRAMVARATWGARTLSPFTARLSHRIAGGGLAGDFDYTRSDAVVDLRHFVGRFEIDTSLTYARTTGDAPIQRLADIGGLTGVRGYPRRTHVGESSLSLRAELPIPYDLLRRSRIPLLKRLGLQFVPWADGARVYNGGSDEWIQSYGLGVQKFLGGFGRGANLRLDIAVPVGPQRPGDVVFYLGFAGN